MLKKVLALCAGLVIAMGVQTGYANDDIIVKVNGERVAFDVEPQLNEGRTFLPVRAVSEALGIQVNWDQESQTADFFGMENDLILDMKNRVYQLNGSRLYIDAEPFITNGRTLVPLRMISEGFGYQVEWTGNEDRRVLITGEESKVEESPLFEEPEPEPESKFFLFNIVAVVKIYKVL